MLEKEQLARDIRDVTYYKTVLTTLGRKDISPYGKDIISGKFIKTYTPIK